MREDMRQQIEQFIERLKRYDYKGNAIRFRERLKQYDYKDKAVRFREQLRQDWQQVRQSVNRIKTATPDSRWRSVQQILIRPAFWISLVVVISIPTIVFLYYYQHYQKIVD